MNPSQFALIVSCEARIMAPIAPKAKRADARLLLGAPDMARIMALAPMVLR